jgi:predicted Zn-dependent peptidase
VDAKSSAGALSSELRELAGLRDEGVLSEEEFDAAKRKLLGS